MTEKDRPPINIILASFCRRLEAHEAILRVVIGHAEISALLTFRGDPEKKALLDFSRYPARVVVEDDLSSANMYVTVPGDVMHEKAQVALQIGLRPNFSIVTIHGYYHAS